MSNYYIVGTKYTDPNNDGSLDSKDILPYCLRRNVIAIGFAWTIDLTRYYNRNVRGLEILLESLGEKPSSIGQMKRFMQLQPGDIIALKGTGAPIGNTARLDIVGYAVVTECDGIVYQHDDEEFPQGLGHIINVEYLEYGIKRTFQLGYGQSIHHIEDPERISQIFGLYADTAEAAKKYNEIARQKNLEEKIIEVSAKYLRTAIHNKIQQNVYDKLVLAFGLANVKMEEDFVDLVLHSKGKTTLIEVKPYNSARQCIVEGLGQLLNYYERSTYEKANLELMIIGNKEASKDDIEFIKFVTATLHIPFTYQGWTELGSK
jgi:hypothetical protein